MKKFYITDESLASSAISMADVFRAVNAINRRVGVWHDDARRMLVIEAENKPKDLRGIKWQKQKEE